MKIYNTDIVCDVEDLLFENNLAMQQMWQDLTKTSIIGLDKVYETLENKFGIETSPETISYNLDVLNNVLSGGTMNNMFPPLPVAPYAKLFTGSEFLQDEISVQFVINIDKNFPALLAKQLKGAIGGSTWLVVRNPTNLPFIGEPRKRLAMQVISACNLDATDAENRELEFIAKYPYFLDLGNMVHTRQPNEPEKLCFCNMADIVQTSRIWQDDPIELILQVACAANVLYQIWADYLDLFGHTKYDSIQTYFDEKFVNYLVDFLSWGIEYVRDRYGIIDTTKANILTIKDISEKITEYGLDVSKRYSTADDQLGGLQRATALAAGCVAAMATGNRNAGFTALYLSICYQKQGNNQQDQHVITDIFSTGNDKGCICELRVPNYQEYIMNIGYSGGYSAIVAAANAGKAFCLNPLVKIAFSSDMFKFNFANPREEFANGTIKYYDIPQIQNKAEKVYQQSIGTPVEEVAYAVNQEVQKWIISDQEHMTRNVENLIFTLKAKIPYNQTNMIIYDTIEDIMKENDLVKQYERIPILISLIPQTVIEGGVVMGSVFRDIQDAQILNESVVKNSFNKVKQEHNEEVAKALLQIGKFIQDSGNVPTGILFDKFNEELNKPNAEKSTLRTIWGGIEKTLPSIATISEVVGKLAPLF